VDATLDRRAFDRRLYAIAAILFALVAVAGFGRTYYLKLAFGTPPLSMLVHVHGLLMSLWVAVFGAQVWLVSTHRVRWHKRLGYAAIGLAAAIVTTGVPTAARAAKYGSASFPPGVTPLGFMIVPLADLVMFVLFFGGAVYWRRSPRTHKALMLLTALNFMPPALARVPIPALRALGPVFFFGLPALLAAACLAAGRLRQGRVDRVLAAGAALLVASYVIRLAAMDTPQWLAVARFVTSFV
jgi:hypothetical protein